MDDLPVTIDEIRTAIDETDAILLKALAARFRAIRALKKLKKHEGVPLEDLNREAQLKALWKQQARELGVPESLALLMLDFILAESKRTQES